ncbi:MAG TPA: hypothetical protein VK550_07830 [Polyangiaceae bacterium]|jgi:hypothetical protein|nr:hypothetical protein [Polyangiaceae bacterium]
MNDPKRLVEDEGTDLERLLLDAARRERPKSSLVPRMLAGLGLGVGLTQTAAPLAAAAKVGVGVWVSVGILAAAGAGFVSARSFAIKEPPAPPVAAPVVTARETAPAMSDAKLRDEIRLLDRARAALRMRAPQQALQELRHYFDGHTQGVLEPEAAVLRIEALRENGDRVQAAAASREFLARHPDGPLADRVRRLAEK